MGFLDDVLGGFGPVGAGTGRLLRRNLKSGEKLLAEGERGTARILGIRIKPAGEHEPERHELLLEWTGADAVVRGGCRQRLGPLARSLRLGMEVPICHDGGQAIIDGAALGGGDDVGAWGYKHLKEPPGEGIDDGNHDLEKERRKADEARATVLALEPVEVLGVRAENVHVHLRVTPAGGEPYEAVVKRALIPVYATHLVEPGTELPVLVRTGRPDKVRIDWPSAALADPGVGRPPSAGIPEPPEPQQVAASSGAAADWSAEGLAADDHGEVDGVSFDTWVRIEAGLVRDRVKPAEHDVYAQHHGVPAGQWEAVQRGWQARMMSDPRVGARFGEAYQAALKGR